MDSIGGNAATIMIPNEQVISSNEIIEAWITSRMIQGGFFNVDAGKTLLINGPLESGPHNIFQGAGAVVIGPNSIGEAKPEWWTDFLACIASLGTRETTLLITHEWVFDDDLTIPATITLRFIQGGSFDVANTKTVTINGKVEGGLAQIFTGAGTVNVTTYPREQLWWGNPQSWDVDTITWQTAPGVADEMVAVDNVAVPGYLGNAAGNGVLRVGAGISYADGGNFVTLDAVPPWTCAWRTYRNAAQAIASGADARILWDTENYDIGADVTTIFTPPADGYYYLHACVSMESMNAGTGVYLRIRKAGPVVLAQERYTIAAGMQSYKVCTTLYLTSGDWVEISLFHNHGVNRAVTVGSSNTWFEGHRIDG